MDGNLAVPHSANDEARYFGLEIEDITGEVDDLLKQRIRVHSCQCADPNTYS